MHTSFTKIGTEVDRFEDTSDSFLDWAEFLEAVNIVSFLALGVSAFFGMRSEVSDEFSESFQEPPPPVSGFISCSELFETVYDLFWSDSYL